MNILILTFYYPPDLCAGSFRVSAFVESLKNRVSDIDNINIVTTMPNRYHSFDTDSARKFEIDENITIRRINISTHKSGFIDQSFSFMQFFFCALNYVKFKKYDLVFATSSRLWTAFLGTIISKIKRVPLYLDIRDIFTDTLKSVLKNSYLRYLIPLFCLIERIVVHSAKKINFVSEGFIDYFKMIKPNLDYIFFPNGIDNEFINYDFHKIKKTAYKIITFAGNIGEGQGLEKIVPEMAKYLKNNFVIWIFGDGGRKKKLENRLKEENIKNVKIFKPVTRNKLLDYYKQSDILFLHLNNYKAFEKVLPSKIFEYAATNKPIIAGVKGYSSEFLYKNVNNVLIFNPADINDFMKKFESYKFESSNRKHFINNFSRKNIMDNFVIDFLKIKK